METQRVKANATLAVVILLLGAFAGFTYAATSNKSDQERIADLERTVAGLQGSLGKLEERVKDMSTAKPRLLDSSPGHTK
jgi:cell division protein FtsL